MNRILVPVNLRSDYDNVLKYAASVGKRSGAEITLFYFGGRRLLKRSGQYLYQSHEEAAPLLRRIRGQRHRDNVAQVIEDWKTSGLSFSLKVVRGGSVSEVVEETKQTTYDLVIMGTHSRSGLAQYFRGSVASRVVGQAQAPVFVVPALSKYNEIQHITYAVDLSDYDPSIIQQVKTIARLFDAKLSITHVNVEAEQAQKEAYLQTLERTISDTLDYPKIYYKFFDHADPIGGIVKFVNLNNSNLVAMINRKKFSWRDRFGDKSFTRRLARKVTVPMLTFHKS